MSTFGSFAVLLLSGAALGDRFGRRRLYALGLVGFALASTACAVRPTSAGLDRLESSGSSWR